DFEVNFVLEKGMHARTMRIPLRPFTLVGATTRPGLLSSPLRERFGILHHLDFYAEEELARIVTRSAGILGVALEPDGGRELARRARGTPRIANRLLRRVRDYTQVKGDGRITRAAADAALTMEGVDTRGLDRLDRRFLQTIVEQFKGGPVGIEAVAAAINDEAETLADPEGVDHRTRHRRAVCPRAPMVRRILAHDRSSGSLSAARVSAGRISSRSTWIWAAWAMDRSGWNVR